MADILSDLYPVTVNFVDGQQPTAQELNAWAGLIDTAFAILSRLIGDFDGESSEQATYITNFVRAMGSLGWINSRLPRGLDQQGSITPTLVELLNPSLLSKEHLLLFPPKNYASISADFDADDTYGDDWTKVDQGTEDIPGANLTAASQWTAWGRRLITSTRIPLNAKVKYVIDTDGATLNSQDYMGSYGPNSGANVVPSLYEIAEDGLDLCVYDTDEFDDSGEHWLTLPKILRCMDPYKPLHSAESISFESVSIHWFSEETTPSYVIPNYIYDLADEDGRLPDGLVSLWVKTSTSIYRLVNQNSEEQIAFYVEADRTRIRLSLPDGFDLPHTADGQEALATQYIVAFAGVSITEAVAQNTARQIVHRHDGTDDGSLVKAVSIANRFEPSQYTESPVSHNHFPQYLLRGGYTADADHLNRHNALLGPILIAQEGATPSNTAEPSVEATTSHGLFFGSHPTGPKLFFNAEDEFAGDPAFDVVGKLIALNKSFRIGEALFLGAGGAGGWISATAGHFKFGLEGIVVSLASTVEAGSFLTSDGLITFGEEGGDAELTVTVGTEATFTFGSDLPTKIAVDRLTADFIYRNEPTAIIREALLGAAMAVTLHDEGSTGWARTTDGLDPGNYYAVWTSSDVASHTFPLIIPLNILPTPLAVNSANGDIAQDYSDQILSVWFKLKWNGELVHDIVIVIETFDLQTAERTEIATRTIEAGALEGPYFVIVGESVGPTVSYRAIIRHDGTNTPIRILSVYSLITTSSLG